MKKIFQIIFLLSLVACEQQIDWEIASGENNIPVIEAILTDEFKTQEIRLTRSFSQLNETPPAITDALVSVSAGGKTVQFFHENSEPGLYKSEEEVRLIRNLTYELKIEIAGKEYTAETELAEVAPIPEIKFDTLRNPDTLFRSDSLILDGNNISPFNPNQQAMYFFNIDWRHISGDSASRAKMIFYTFSSVDVSEVIPAPRNNIFFPPGSIVTIEKYGLKNDFAEYLRAVAIETEWDGNFFYNSGGNVPTNISGGGLGFFSACSVESERVIAK